MPEPIATWNPVRGAWEKPDTEALICGHSERYSETWPASGMTRGGSAYELPTSAPPTGDSESSSLLPTPIVTDGTGGAADPNRPGHVTQLRDIRSLIPTPRASRGGSGTETMYKLGGERSDENRPQGEVLLPTPSAADGNGGGRMGSDGHQMPLPGSVIQLLPSPRVSMHHGPSETEIETAVAVLLKTPTAQLAVNGGSQHPDKRKGGGHGPTLADEVEHLLPTPTTRDHKGRNQRDDPTCLTGALLPTPRAQHGETRNQNIWARPLDQPQNLENALARIGDPTPPLSAAGNPYLDD